MKLYHGTTERHLERIFQLGLAPRDLEAGNWDDFPSRPDMVYLTSAYPLYFAAASAEDGDRLVVLEFELDDLEPIFLFPDEDVVAQSVSHHEGRPLKEVHREVVEMLEVWQDKWEAALKAMGTVAYQGVIPATNIRRLALIDPSARETPALFWKMLDPAISIMNFKVMGDYYTQLVEWVMGYREALPRDMSMEGLKHLDREMYEAKVKFLESESVDRSGIEVWDEGKLAQKIKDITGL